MRHTKLATCAYCGTQTTICLSDVTESLSCAGCGAAIRDLRSVTQTAHARAYAGPGPRPHRQRPVARLPQRLLRGAVEALDDFFD
ncbi:hypothetical protein [Pseudoponticoccus marisrubri]|uniref:Uncharacterized protein n=1 Tax=Pseudoponticoccus marisrubri TaxID=1685382 RepID=A0A0W7WP14_9RHOB|nr:hypothetical protein [Pseudoponticoccus marisrubri]KUF12273.1 hypothetical protein AVJ23_00620 [Pseudoponticoccus marisrubri]